MSNGVSVHTMLSACELVHFPEARGWDFGHETVLVYDSEKAVIAEFAKPAVVFVERGLCACQPTVKIEIPEEGAVAE